MSDEDDIFKSNNKFVRGFVFVYKLLDTPVTAFRGNRNLNLNAVSWSPKVGLLSIKSPKVGPQVRKSDLYFAWTRSPKVPFTLDVLKQSCQNVPSPPATPANYIKGAFTVLTAGVVTRSSASKHGQEFSSHVLTADARWLR